MAGWLAYLPLAGGREGLLAYLSAVCWMAAYQQQAGWLDCKHAYQMFAGWVRSCVAHSIRALGITRSGQTAKALNELGFTRPWCLSIKQIHKIAAVCFESWFVCWKQFTGRERGSTVVCCIAPRGVRFNSDEGLATLSLTAHTSKIVCLDVKLSLCDLNSKISASHNLIQEKCDAGKRCI